MSAAPPAVIRRRRQLALGGLLLALAAAAVVLALARGGSGGMHARYVPPGGPATVIDSGTGSRGGGGGAAADPAPAGPQFKPPAAVSTAIARLTPPQQAAELFLVGVAGQDPQRAVRQLRGLAWGGVVLDRTNVAGGPARARALARALAAALKRAGPIPPLIGATQEGGPQTAIPGLPPEGEVQLGTRADVAVAEAQALSAGQALRQLGIRLNLAPLADVDTPTGPLTGRLFGTDPQLVSQLASAELRGYAQAGEIPVLGHFPGEGAASADPEQQPATVGGPLAALESRDLVPFAQTAARAPVILLSNAAYAAFDGVTPASLSPPAVSLLRDRLHFGGVVMGDDLDAALQPAALTPGAAAVAAVKAGVDLLYITGSPAEQAQALAGVIAEAQRSSEFRALVRVALERVLALKYRYGLLG